MEQRLGRIHHISQTQVCHLWNMVASEMRESEVCQKLFYKIEIERRALDGRVFDILSVVFDGVISQNILVPYIFLLRWCHCTDLSS